MYVLHSQIFCYYFIYIGTWISVLSIHMEENRSASLEHLKVFRNLVIQIEMFCHRTLEPSTTDLSSKVSIDMACLKHASGKRRARSSFQVRVGKSEYHLIVLLIFAQIRFSRVVLLLVNTL